MQLPPSPQLSHIVKHYLLLVGEKGASLNYRVFSDGNPGMVFHLHDPLMRYNESQVIEQAQPRSFVYGQLTRYNNIVSSGKLGMLVVVLQPYGIPALFRLPAHELNDATVKLNEIFGQEALDLEEQILALENTSAIIALVERFLINKCMLINKPDLLVNGALKLINSSKGNITIGGLLNALPVTERQLERKFNEHIGITPKKFSGIVKLHHFLKMLQKASVDKAIGNIVYDCGYYDQAHLNNFFKKSTGITPSEYQANKKLLAINFMPLK
jgi:AraC-like DNA-binding protein